MEDEKQLAREAMEANGLKPGEGSEEELKMLEKQIARKRRGVRAFKWCTYGALGLFVLFMPFALFALSRIEPSSESIVEETIGGILVSLFYIGIFCAIFYWVRSHGLSRLETKAQLERISLQLEKLSKQAEEK